MTKSGYYFSLCALIVATCNCMATDYYIDPRFSSTQRYDTNINLRPNPPQANWITTVSPAANFGLRHENGELNSNFTWNQLFYTNQSELDIDEQLFSIDYKHKTERFDWNFKNSYNNRSSLNTEGTVLGGLNTIQVMTKQLNLAPSVSYSLNELSSLSFDYSYNKTNYDKNKGTLFRNDYDYHQASGTLTHFYTEQDKLNATLSGSRYKLVQLEFPTYNEVAQLGWQHSFSEQLVTNVSAGMNFSQSQSSNILFGNINGTNIYLNPVTGTFTPDQNFKSSQVGQVFQASINKTFERGSISLIGARNQTPTSQGLQTSTSLSINNAYTINERWTSGLSASYSSYESASVSNSSLNRTYSTISPNINWKWTPEVNLGLSYTFRQQEYERNSQLSQGNTVQLQFTYQPQINRQVK